MLAGLLLLGAMASSPAPPTACAYDPKILSLGVDAFDQDMQGGWRTLAGRPGCESKAADVIKAYRSQQEEMLPVLSWHEGQLRADLGEYADAIALMERSRTTEQDVIGWNPYVDATVAFLRGDEGALHAARQRLASWPKPAKNIWVDDSGHPLPIPDWPPNLSVVDGLIHCFGKPYKQAYSEACQK